MRVPVVFTDQATGIAFDPTALSFSYKNPAGVVTTLVYGVDSALTKTAIGNYRVDINANAAGIWSWRCASTGSGQAAAEGRFYVRPSLV